MKKSYYPAGMLIGIFLLTGCNGNNLPRKENAIKVKTENIKLSSITGLQSFSGTIEEESGSALSFMTTGTLKQISASQGMMVHKGTLLATVDDATLRNAHDAALASREQAEDAYSRMKLLHDNNSLPEIQWVEIQSKLKQAVAAEQIAKKSLSDSRLYAPYSGFIAAKLAEVGQNILPGAPVLKIVKIDQVKVKISIPENEIAKIKKSEAIQINVPALNNKVFTGKIIEKGVTANALSRSYEVKAIISNPQHELLPGMMCDVYLNNSANTAAKEIVLLPTVVSIDSNNKEFVWINNKGKAEKRFVATGKSVPGGVIIAKGLSENEEVIVEGQQKVSEGTKINLY